MALPKKVQEQADEAKKLHAEMYGQSKDGKEKGQPESKRDDGAEGRSEQSEAGLESKGEAPPETQDKESKASEGQEWEHRYRVLQGKYNAEVPRLHQEVKALRAELEQLAKAKEEPEPEQKPQQKSLLSDEDIEDYGEDLIDVIKRAAKEELLPELDRLREENRMLKEQVSTVSTSLVESERDKLVRVLTEQVPNWEEINTNDDFLQWLNEQDAFSGARRHDMLLQAFEENDAARVVAFFKGFIKENKAFDRTSEAGRTPAESNRGQPKVDMESLVAPGKPSGGEATTSSAQENERVWTQSDIAAFYSAVRRGAYRGKESEKRAIEQQIIKAANEGRVR